MRRVQFPLPDSSARDVQRNQVVLSDRLPLHGLHESRHGHFGGRSARVLWVGAGLDCPELLGLQEDLETELASAGWPKEGRKFSGHLTLCRVRNAKAGIKLAQITKQYKDVDLGTVRCASVMIFNACPGFSNNRNMLSRSNGNS